MLHVPLVSPLLSELTWLDHGFGTRGGPLSQDEMASLRQIHSSTVLVADDVKGCVGEGDALVTNHRSIPISIRTADCLPILLADPRNRAVAVVHAGWRGSAEHIVQKALDRMLAEFATRLEDVYAAIGPGIGACCYEVGLEVARQFGMNDAGRLDLSAENRRQMVERGVAECHIDALGLCTKCDAERFHSYRRDGTAAGRMISYIAVRG